MKATTGIGIGGAIAALLLSVIMEGGNPAALLNIPALIIVVAGTGAATMASTTMERMKAIPALYKVAIKADVPEASHAAQQMVGLAEKARRDGLLALERDLAEVDDEFARRGVQLVVDGTDSELVRSILYSEIDAMSTRHKASAEIFKIAGGFAPTLGILGTVLSLVHVLENLSSPRTLGHAIAGAFLATLYGVGSANLIYLPVSNKLKELSQEELGYREMLVEAILAIQAGDNPRMLREKLDTFLPPHQRGEESTPKRAEAAPEAATEPEPELEEAAA